ncbi:2-C-methyl-D-erythritol 4-phosphate cytidylyltransferase [uncultured Roseobacter sp.]|uniref:2-C-methyl-D-erythritol 4-phosphate cytidylyltransferase n=1 Tax=uncultured Roseobacter sp. TaxID=114847 RepID=UPI002632A73D|nr:2-C-methyl-D-erythritol 4-phosphate cytidylyltransferase [uncultured Roseobacter sp.]
MKIGAVIVAAGRGTRAGEGIAKQWRPLAGKSSAFYALDAFARHPRVDHLVLVVAPADLDAGMVFEMPEVEIVPGGASRSASVLAGLDVLEGSCDRVLIHDAARPCISRRVIDDVLDALETTPAAAPALPVVDALWRGANGRVVESVARDGLFRAQTPQGFHLPAILAAHRAHPEGAADDVALALLAGLEVAMTPGCQDNLKITVAADFDRAALILKGRYGHQAR